jgi:hypothetical protein
MSFLQVLSHLFYFFLPAFAMAGVCVISGAWLFGAASAPPWKSRWAWNCVAGALVLIGGLVWFDNDGKMATYGALVLVSASLEWVLQRGWQHR